MWNFLLDLVGTDSMPEHKVDISSNIDTSSFTFGLFFGLVWWILLTLLILYTIKIIKDNNHKKDENTKDNQD